MRGVMLEAALKYAARGVAVFPCEPRGKRPRTRNGVLDATTDRDQIEQWWRADGCANVALACGRASDLVVLDLDGDEGTETLRALEREHGRLPLTASVVTAGGGAHYYFRHPGGVVRNSVRTLGPGVDVRGDGGYIIAPPSRGANGRSYEVDERAPRAEMPEWLLERLRKPQGTRQRVPTSEWLDIARGVERGQRNHALARLVGHLLSRDVDARLVAALSHAVNARFRPPLGTDEVDRVVESIAGLELRKRGGR